MRKLAWHYPRQRKSLRLHKQPANLRASNRFGRARKLEIHIIYSVLLHSSVKTAMIYLHILDRPGAGAPSLLDLD